MYHNTDCRYLFGGTYLILTVQVQAPAACFDVVKPDAFDEGRVDLRHIFFILPAHDDLFDAGSFCCQHLFFYAADR